MKIKFLASLLVFAAGLCWAEETELALGNIVCKGETLTNCHARVKNPAEVVLRYEGGFTQTATTNLPAEAQAKLGYDAAKAAAWQAERTRKVEVAKPKALPPAEELAIVQATLNKLKWDGKDRRDSLERLLQKDQLKQRAGGQGNPEEIREAQNQWLIRAREDDKRAAALRLREIELKEQLGIK